MKRKQKKFIEIYKKKLFNVTATCNAMNMSRSLYYKWLSEEEFKDAIHYAQEEMIDFVETKLMSLINEGSEKATIFFMSTKGRNRGYEQLKSVQLSGGVANVVSESVPIEKVEEVAKKIKEMI